MPLILGTNSIKDTGFNIDNSCRFNAADSAYLTRTFGSAGNRRTWTFSTWCKRAKFGAQQTLFGTSSDGSNYHLFYWGSDESLTHNFNGTVTGTTQGFYRDPSAWYHVVCAVDTTQSTAANRVKIYVNGASVGSGSYPSEDAEMTLNNNVRCDVGSSGAHFTSHMLGGYLAETVFIDGTQYAASDFGEYDSDSPTIWKPKDVSGLTFGTNGFWFDYKASGTLGNDANGGTDWTATNLAAADQATDTPTNNFATMNNLIPGVSNITYSEGNLLVTQASAAWVKAASTIGMSAGKWYWEAKWVGDNSGSGSWLVVGVDNNTTASTTSGYTSTSVGWKKNGDIGVATTLQTDIATYAEGDVLSVALDMDNDAIYFRKNGASWENSGDPTSGATKTGAYSLPVANSTYFATISPYDTSIAGMNFGGCPSFAISSGNADANGYGNFEYAPPSGYYSLCTKNLAEYGG